LEIEPVRHDELSVPTREELNRQSRTLIGQIQQTPPAYSAVWVDGQRAYQRVRRGEDVQMPSRTVAIKSLQIRQYQFPELEIDIVCGSGTYIRTLGIDLAKGVGSCAVMSYLQRTSVGPFDIADAVSIDRLREDDLATLLKPPSLGVEHLPKLMIDQAMSDEIGYGRCIDGTPTPHAISDTDVAALTPEGELRAIMRWKRNRWCPYRVF
jgi:tRNA pseudouridine55 synthase